MDVLWKLRGIAVLLLWPVSVRVGPEKRRRGNDANGQSGRVGRLRFLLAVTAQVGVL